MAHFFDKLSETEAREFFQRYLSHGDERLCQLVHSLAPDGEDSEIGLDYSPESLAPLWHWAVDRLNLHGTIHYPPWLIEYMSYDVSSYETWRPRTPEATLLDTVAFYVAAVCIKHLPGVAWDVCRLKSIDYNQPVLTGFKFTPHQPRRIVSNAAARVIDRDAGDDALVKAFQRLAIQVGPLIDMGEDEPV